MKQMFQDMMSQLGTLSLVLAKSKDKPPSAASKEARHSKANDISDGEASEQSEETDMGRKPIFEVSEPMQAFLQLAFCRARPTDNKTRTWVERFSVPERDETRCPKLDSIVKNELQKDVVELDRKLSHLQNFVLDAAAPLVAVMEELTVFEKPDPEVVLSAIQQLLMFLGNASTHFNLEQRSKALSWLNPDLKLLVDDEDFFRWHLTCLDPVLKERPRRGWRRWSVCGKHPRLGVRICFFEAAVPTKPEMRAAFKTATLSMREKVSNSPFKIKSYQKVSEQSSLQGTQCPRRTDLWGPRRTGWGCPRRTEYKYCSRCTDKTPYKSMFPFKEKFKKYFVNSTNKRLGYTGNIYASQRCVGQCSQGRSVGNSQAELGNSDFRLLSFTDSTELQPRASYSFHPVNSSRAGAFARKARDNYEGGDKKFIRKRGHREGEGTTPSSVYFIGVSYPKKDGSMRPVSI